MKISYAYFKTDLGLLLLGCTEENEVGFLEFGSSKKELLTMLNKAFPKANCQEESVNVTKKYQGLVSQLVAGKGMEAKTKVYLSGTPFQEAVWNYLMTIPVGETRSYTEVAKAIKKPKAVRAAAKACAYNRVGMLIACHRIVRSDGGISGYRWGVERKLELLKREARNK